MKVRFTLVDFSKLPFTPSTEFHVWTTDRDKAYNEAAIKFCNEFCNVEYFDD